jgi:predicted nucleotidyltransferase
MLTGKPHRVSGLDLGDGVASLAVTTVIVRPVVFLSVTRGDTEHEADVDLALLTVL